MAIKQVREQKARQGQSTIKKRSPFSKEKIAQQKKLQAIKVKRQTLFREGVLLFLIGIGIIGLLQVKTHRVEGESMLPTLKNNDRIVVKKNQSPNRYDLITFDPEIPYESSYVKRVVGMPGDQIWTDQTSLYLRTAQAVEWHEEAEQQMTAVQLPDSTLKVTVSEEVARNLRNIEVIPQGSYFVLGDNRKASKDSRSFGLINAEQIEGTVFYRYFPFARVGGIN
ncbi:signal peptidase I [Enterococcus termitis]|uniref:Signal peptidase I n=1 Tax=Enterococcus termitis TaxID=332950 RepID=A0A1E5GI88_9ENTE|nr:signal peptidase I [Enterococcus termitis]OEG12434.1 signal peptidase I [Enterococcus termitis]OJG98733.1 signal peptidase I [Enterococcus termitis]